MKKRFIRTDNNGLTVKLNFWSLKTYQKEFDSQHARHHVKGEALNVNTGRSHFFGDAGELLMLLGDWQVAQFKKLKKGKKDEKRGE